jgi:glycosyltransferase involved in cell wall biosynthesis
MKVAEIICAFPPYKGGMGKVALENFKILKEGGYETTVFTPSYSIKRGFSGGGSSIKRLFPLLRYGNAAVLPQLFFKLKNFDIVHLHYPFFGSAEIVWLAKKLSKRKFKLIVTYHMEASGEGFIGLIFDFYRKYIMPRIMGSADKIIVSSTDYAMNSEVKEILKENPEKFIEIPFGVDIEKFKPREKKQSLIEKYHLGTEEKTILFVGGLDKAHYFKGVPKLIKAFHNFLMETKIQAQLVIVGDGSERFNYEQIAFDYGLRDRVIFMGPVKDDELPYIYNLADLFVLPSINKGEAFGIVLLEAAASGIPVIASDLPGVRSVVREGYSGYLTPPGNPDILTKQLKEALSDESKLKVLGKDAREVAIEYYDENKLKKRFIDIFKNV